MNLSPSRCGTQRAKCAEAHSEMRGQATGNESTNSLNHTPSSARWKFQWRIRLSGLVSDFSVSADLSGANDDQTRGIDIIRRALQAPLRQIAQNAGHDGAVVVGNLLREADQTMGFNAQTDKYENLIVSGVIDPTKVVRSALQDAASVAGLLITTEAAIAEIVEDKPSMPSMPGGGMGGMGDMGF